ncbi:hypothetical protein INT48_002728 [Thamnidium elegans]|uniref:Uncharacterized protein n=1 Tax=Thamnidium elegans TaxID=101142 RepID=A0A8H7SHW1_9FUNG|nr:hypothetical protein INT48_002728 [Thamnidium elegans]
MNIPPLNLSSYLKDTKGRLSDIIPISYLVTPPTSPDSEKPAASTSQPRKRVLNDLSISSAIPKKIKPNSNDKDDQKLDLNLLDLYLSSGKSIDVKDTTYGLNLLCWACQCKSIEAVKKLIRQGYIDINERNGPHQITALHIAAAVNFYEGIDCLTEHPDLDLNIKDAFGLTAVHYAAKHNKNDAVYTLLEVGARSDIFDQYGRLALHYAIRNSNKEIVQMILSKRGSNNPTFTNLIWSSTNKNHCIIEEAIFMAVGNQLDILKLFFNVGMLISVASGGWWEDKYQDKRDGLIELCVEWNRFECLRFLVINTNIPLRCQALDLAVRERKLDFVKYLCDNVGINPCHKNGDNLSLLYAANHGFMEMIPHLLTPNTSTDCIQQAILFTKLNGKCKTFCDALQKYQKTSDVLESINT